jgi:hypothetical protein
MAISKKKKKKEESPIEPEIVHYTPCEWMIQFDDDEPQLFAQSDDTSQSHEVVIKLQNTNHSHITFENTINGKRFKMWARPKQK